MMGSNEEMEQRPRVVLHIGYPKTATTTLQQQVFLPWHHAGTVDYLGVFQTMVYPFDFADLSDRLRETMYLADHKAALSQAENCNLRLRAMATRDKSTRPIVISSEHFTMGGYSTQRRDVAIWPHRSAQRLSRVLDGFDVQVLVVLRDHVELAQAYFLQHKATPLHANAGRYASIERFITDILGREGCHAQMFQFSGVLEAYAQVFGQRSIHVHGFPAICRDMEAFVAEIRRLTADTAEFTRIQLSRTNARRRTSLGYQSVRLGLGAHLAAAARRSPRLTRLLRRLPGAGLMYSLLERIQVSKGAEADALTQSQVQAVRQAFSEDRSLLRDQWDVRI